MSCRYLHRQETKAAVRKKETEDMLAGKKAALLSSSALSGILGVAKIVSVFCLRTPTQFPRVLGAAAHLDLLHTSTEEHLPCVTIAHTLDFYWASLEEL